jgi:hypothetical protein
LRRVTNSPREGTCPEACQLFASTIRWRFLDWHEGTVIKSGSFALDKPSDDELVRRERMTREG